MNPLQPVNINRFPIQLFIEDRVPPKSFISSRIRSHVSGIFHVVASAAAAVGIVVVVVNDDDDDDDSVGINGINVVVDGGGGGKNGGKEDRMICKDSKSYRRFIDEVSV